MVEAIRELLAPELEGFELDVFQMAFRAAIVYLVAVMVVRLGHKRFMGRNSAFDLILGILLGSVLSRGITGQSPFWPTMAAGGVLMAMHWILALIAFHWELFGPWVKGRPTLLVKDGEILKKHMRQCRVGDNDLEEALRRAGLQSIDDVVFAHLERSGNISIVPRDKNRWEVLEIKVEEGVQTVRIKPG